MDKFNGFSQDEINRVAKGDNKHNCVGRQAKTETMKVVARGPHAGIRRLTDKWTAENNNKNNGNLNIIKAKQQQDKKTISKLNPAQKTNNVTTAPSESAVATTAADSTQDDEESMGRGMTKSIEEALFFQPLKILAMNNQPHQQQEEAKEQNEVVLTNSDTNANDLELAHLGNVVLSVDSPFKGLSLQEFESHRKLMEEQNKQKKQMLCKAIEMHSQKTAAETRKIEEVKSELAKLDKDLAVNVTLLRKQIDAACIHFTNIEKQYMKIEAQFLKSKMELHQAAEKKELLTEHLCTVIAHNEDRKAEKLTELMKKVGLTTTGDLEHIEKVAQS